MNLGLDAMNLGLDAMNLGLDAMNSVGERLLIEAAWPGRMGLHWRLSRAPKLFAGDLQRTDLTGSSQCFRCS